MKILICSGFPLDWQKGNSVTAKRLEKLFTNHGLESRAVHTQRAEQADALIALNGIKTANTILQFHQDFPNSAIHVVLTGTDIHREIHVQEALAEQVFKAASSLVVAHPECIHELPQQWRGKVRVIYPSVELPKGLKAKCFDTPAFTCLGHLREVKNSHQMWRALQLIPDAQLQGFLLGAALEKSDEAIAMQHQEKDARYQWLSDLGRAEALEYMMGSVATLNTSLLEGGANSVVEAIVLGVPVLASNIDGNRGLLGEDYAGLYPLEDDEALSVLIEKIIYDEAFRDSLKAQLEERSSLFTAQRELSSWIKVVNEFTC